VDASWNNSQRHPHGLGIRLELTVCPNKGVRKKGLQLVCLIFLLVVAGFVTTRPGLVTWLALFWKNAKFEPLRYSGIASTVASYNVSLLMRFV